MSSNNRCKACVDILAHNIINWLFPFSFFLSLDDWSEYCKMFDSYTLKSISFYEKNQTKTRTKITFFHCFKENLIMITNTHSF